MERRQLRMTDRIYHNFLPLSQQFQRIESLKLIGDGALQGFTEPFRGAHGFRAGHNKQRGKDLGYVAPSFLCEGGEIFEFPLLSSLLIANCEFSDRGIPSFKAQNLTCLRLRCLTLRYRDIRMLLQLMSSIRDIELMAVIWNRAGDEVGMDDGLPSLVKLESLTFHCTQNEEDRQPYLATEVFFDFLKKAQNLKSLCVWSRAHTDAENLWETPSVSMPSLLPLVSNITCLRMHMGCLYLDIMEHDIDIILPFIQAFHSIEELTFASQIRGSIEGLAEYIFTTGFAHRLLGSILGMAKLKALTLYDFAIPKSQLLFMIKKFSERDLVPTLTIDNQCKITDVQEWGVDDFLSPQFEQKLTWDLLDDPLFGTPVVYGIDSTEMGKNFELDVVEHYELSEMVAAVAPNVEFSIVYMADLVDSPDFDEKHPGKHDWC
jgi:hypothetical protein